MSSDALGLRVDVDRLLDGAYVGDVGIEHGEALLAFTNAIETGEPDPAAARERLRDLVGDEGVLEAAATIAIFNGLVRVADGTGIQLDGGVFAFSAADRERLGIDRFAGAANGTSARSPSDAGVVTLSIGDLFGDHDPTTTDTTGA